MNQSFEELAEEMGSALDNLAAIAAAYQEIKDQQSMTTVQTAQPFKVDVVLAGVRSCMLAAQVLRLSWSDPHGVDERLAVAAAHSVLETWGLDISEEPPSPAPESDPAPAPTVETLVWPPVTTAGRPLYTTLPDVYKENYYHVRERVLVLDNPAISGTAITPDHRLVLVDSYWNEEALQWRMKFSNISFQNKPFWIDHCKVKVGEEIPKDAAP